MHDLVAIAENLGATNTVDNDEFYNLVRLTCEHIYKLLVDHCGPTAKDALIILDNPSNLKDRHYAVFTKDGINIVKSIEFVSPIQKHIQNLIAYVGSRVESLSHDGTTTSMLLTTALLLRYMEDICTALKHDINIDRRAIQKKFTDRIKVLFDQLDQNYAITVDELAATFGLDRPTAIRFVAHHQAMVSSKGDVELTTAILEVLETLPRELYSQFNISQTEIETDNRFLVTRDEFNFEIPVMANIDHMNHQMQTEYLAQECDLIVSEDDLVQGNRALTLVADTIMAARAEAFPTKVKSDIENLDLKNPPEFVELMSGKPVEPGSYIILTPARSFGHDGVWYYAGPGVPLSRPERKKDIVIITKSLDSALVAKLAEINWYSQNKVVVFQVSTPHQYSSNCTVLSALLAVAGRYSLQEHLADRTKPFLISDAKVHYRNRRLQVSNLYVKDGSLYHPSFNNPDAFLPYTRMVQEIKTTLDDYNSGRTRVESAADQLRRSDYTSIYQRMICAEVRTIKIAGRTHDVLADREVFMDTFGAVLSSIEHGFVIDGYLKMNGIAREMLHSADDPNHIKDVMLNILAVTHQASLATIEDKVREYAAADNKKYSYYFFGRGLQQLVSIVDTFPVVGDGGSEVIGVPSVETLLIQPADTYRELRHRIIDLVPKLINTNRAIIPGTVNNRSAA